MEILVTGGSGLIGSELIPELLKLGHFVINYDKRKDNFKNEFSNEKYHFIQGDILDHENLLKQIKQVNGIIHLAAISRVISGQKFPDLCKNVNINGTVNVLNCIKKIKDKPWLIFGSSREVYGEPKSIPVNEDFPLNPISIYGSTKVKSELSCKEFHKKFNINTAILRFSNVYGNLNDYPDRVIPLFINNILRKRDIVIRGKDKIFDFTHVSDTVSGIIKTIELLNQYKDGFYDSYQILTGEGTYLTDIISIISKYTSLESKIIYEPPNNFDVIRFIGNPKKAFTKLGYFSKISIKEGLKRTIDLLKNKNKI